MKPQVHYHDIPGVPAQTVGNRTVVRPLDHPDQTHVSNKTTACTTEVVAVFPDGFETKNTRYVRVGVASTDEEHVTQRSHFLQG